MYILPTSKLSRLNFNSTNNKYYLTNMLYENSPTFSAYNEEYAAAFFYIRKNTLI